MSSSQSFLVLLIATLVVIPSASAHTVPVYRHRSPQVHDRTPHIHQRTPDHAGPSYRAGR